MRQETKKVWAYLSGLGLLGFWQRIEDMYSSGVPDVHYLLPDSKSGWIELKYVPSWPKRPTTETDLGIRTEQALWINKYCRKGGKAFVLVRVENEWLLVPGTQCLDKATRATWYERAGVMRWERRLNPEEFQLHL